MLSTVSIDLVTDEKYPVRLWRILYATAQKMKANHELKRLEMSESRSLKKGTTAEMRNEIIQAMETIPTQTAHPLTVCLRRWMLVSSKTWKKTERQATRE